MMRFTFIGGLMLSGLLALPAYRLPGPEPAGATLQVRIRNTFGPAPVRLYQPFVTLAGDTIELTRYGYYLSNIRLRRPDGTAWAAPQSYHLLETPETGAAEELISLPGVPAGEYSALEFAVGVDSSMNHSGAQPGVLNPDYGMFWQWESGYIFLKCEGYVRQSGRPQGALVVHIGRDACYRRIRLPFGAGRATVTNNGHLALTVQADARRLFGGFVGAPLTLTLSRPPAATSIQGGPNAPKVADNYARMFALQTLESN